MLPDPTQPTADRRYLEVESELRTIASRMLNKERAGHTLQPTALMHEAWIRLATVRAQFADDGHFIRAAAGTMRRILVEHARARAREKRGGGDRSRVTLTPEVLESHAGPDDLVAVDEAMHGLARLDPELERIVELRVFGGLSHPEIAALIGKSLRSVERDWRLARAILRRALEAEV